MPTRIRVGIGDLVAATKQYVEAEVKKANVNGNAYLTLEEAKKLPADLQDNFEAFRKAGHSRVSVRQFTETFVDYVSKRAAAADKNHDGTLTRTDASKLPKDLRDNFLTYLSSLEPAPLPLTDTDKGRAALASYVSQVLFNSGDPEGAAFREAVLSWRTPADQASVRAQMEAEAAAWSPTSPDWEKTVSGDTTTYAGPFFQLYTEVRFKAGDAMPSVYVEID